MWVLIIDCTLTFSCVKLQRAHAGDAPAALSVGKGPTECMSPPLDDTKNPGNVIYTESLPLLLHDCWNVDLLEKCKGLASGTSQIRALHIVMVKRKRRTGVRQGGAMVKVNG